MLRTTAARPLFKSLVQASATRSSYTVTAKTPTIASHIRQLSSKRPQALVATPCRPVTISLLRYATKSDPPSERVDPKTEAKIQQRELDVNPELVSGGSSVRHVFEPAPAKQDDGEMLDGIKADLVSGLSNNIISVIFPPYFKCR